MTIESIFATDFKYHSLTNSDLIENRINVIIIICTCGFLSQQFAVWYNRQSAIPLSYLIGIPLGWLLLGLLQYFVCVIVLGDILLDPWYFTCTWIVEVISTLPITLFVIVAKCLYVRMVSERVDLQITAIYSTIIYLQFVILIFIQYVLSRL